MAEFDIQGARKAGYSDAEIANYLGQAAKFDTAAARKAGYSDAEIITQLAPKARQPKLSALDVITQAIQNIPGSAVESGKGIVSAVTSPVQTAGTLLDLAAGALNRAVPAPVRDVINLLDTDPASTERAIKTAQQVGGVYRQRYGSTEAIKRTIATDPVGAAADLSTILAGGASLARAGAKATTRAAPRVSQAATQAANVMARGAEVTNPLNVLSRPTAMGAKALSKAPVAARRFVSPKQTAYMEAAEGRAPELIRQLRAPDLELVPGSMPTAAQAASPLGITKFSALGESAAKVMPTPYYAREVAGETARLNAMRSVGKTPADVSAAVAAREAATSPLYQAAEARGFRADPKLAQLADDPYIQQALPDAIRLSKSQGVTFRNNPTRFIHNVKISLDKMLTKTGETALARGERSQVTGVKNRLVNWLEGKAPEYGQARTIYAAMSKPINQMEVGQYLEGKLTAPLEGGAERAGVFATAVKDAPGTIKRATTGEARFKALTDILDPDQVRVVESIKKDLERAAITKRQAKAGAGAAPKAGELATAAERGVRLPNLLNRVTAVANDIMSRLRGRIDGRLAIQLATEMLDPQAAANALEKAYKAEQRAVAAGKKAEKAVTAAGRAVKSPVVLAGERAQNAMLNNSGL